MRRQGALSLKIAAVFILLLIGLPIFNATQPALAATKLGGFTLTWLVLGVLFYPTTCLLSVIFVRRSDAIEHELTEEHRA